MGMNFYMDINYKFWTLTMIQKDDEILLLERKHDNFKGFIPPGGKLEFPESFTDSAIREVKEETGLKVKQLIFKGIYEYVNPEKNDRYIILNYLTKDFEGELLKESKEGVPRWFKIDEAFNIPMQKSIKRRLPLFFEEGTFEIHVVWDNEKDDEKEVIIKNI